MKTYRKLVWAPILIGVALVLVGAAASLRPAVIIKILPVVLGVLAVVYGTVRIVLAMVWKELAPASPRVIGGAASIVMGVVLAVNRTISVAFIGVVIGLFAVVSGVARAVHAWRTHVDKGTFRYTMLNSALRVIIGVIMLLNPFFSMAAMAALIGIYLIFAGISIIIGAICCKDTFDIWW